MNEIKLELPFFKRAAITFICHPGENQRYRIEKKKKKKTERERERERRLHRRDGNNRVSNFPLIARDRRI